jgi:predicted ATPase/class 3 adenylate cyclase
MPNTLPSGVVTLLFTDIEGSTKLLHELGDAYGPVLAEHRRIVRSACAEHGGVEVDTQGDAFFVAFARATDAVAAAAETQRALAAGPVRVRIGLHTGEPRPSEEGYVGLDVHKGARIAAAGHGGQVLLSEATRALVEAPVRDLGPHRLKDLSVPERLYELEIEGLERDFPPLKTMEAGMKNLPVQRTSFVGRSNELDEIDRLLSEPACRLLTLVGPGGIGKTRLALEAAARRVESYPHGVHFVPLASVASPEFLAPTVAESMQFSVDAAHSAIAAEEQLLDFLRERSALLVLDNFEHLVDGSTLLSNVIEQAPQVELLTTSRERLNLQSEWVFDVEGLGLSENGNGTAGALHLFVERALQVEPGFVLGDEERADAHRICRLVDGMPLGIELAASWVSMLSCSEIADEIEGHIDFLATSMRDVPERHRSLRAAIDQSWRLLTDEQREVFARLSVFRGSFDREAARSVTGADLRVLSELVAKSLLRRSDFSRFELHELLRQYGAEKLAAAPADESDARALHARHYGAMLIARSEALLGPALAVARDELRSEVDNLRAAAEWSLENGEEGSTRELLAVLHTFFWVHSPFDGAETFEQLALAADFDENAVDAAGSAALSAATFWVGLATDLGYDPAFEKRALDLLPALRARGLEFELGSCLLTLGIVATYVDVYPDAVAYLEEAIAVAQVAGDGLMECAALSWLGFVQLLVDDLDASLATFEACLTVAKRLGGPLLEAYALSKLGIHADAEERYEDAMGLHVRANALFDSVGDRGGAGYTLSRASMSAFGMGDYSEALRLGRAGYEAFSEVSHRWGMIAALCRIGFPALALGEWEEASQCFSDALERAHASAAISLELLALSGIGAMLAERGDPMRAATMLTFALGHEQLPAAYGFPARPALDRLEAELPEEELAAARDAASTTTVEQLVEDARQAVLA